MAYRDTQCDSVLDPPLNTTLRSKAKAAKLDTKFVQN